MKTLKQAVKMLGSSYFHSYMSGSMFPRAEGQSTIAWVYGLTNIELDRMVQVEVKYLRQKEFNRGRMKVGNPRSR